MRKEPIVFLALAAFLGWKFNGMRAEGNGRARRPPSNHLEYVGAVVPDVDVALADSSRSDELGRDLFSPPSPTKPLPPLPIDLPPLEPLGAIAAPSSWGPGPKHFGALMRRAERPEGARDLPGLFEIEDVDLDDEVADDLEVVDPLEDLDDPDARAERIAALKKQYDWIYLSSHRFGRIQNPERYTPGFLDAGVGGAAIVFVEVDPTTGVPRFNGQAIEYTRDRVPNHGEHFGLVDNVTTEIEVGHASFPEPIPAARFEAALTFAERCLLLRNESTRALEVAEDLYRRVQGINTQDDARPRLGLARCYELGFRLDDAYKTYEDLLASGHDTNATVHARLAELMGRLRLDGPAEERFEEALRVERTSWEARWRFGRFLVERGRVEEALPHLREAVQREPKGSDDRAWRVQVRLANAGALLEAGRPDEAFDGFVSANSADMANEVGMAETIFAGMLSAARFSTRPNAQAMVQGPDMGASGAPEGGGSFELLLAAGLVAMDNGQYESSATMLQLARQADPFRAHEALRALSRLAELSGNPEDALTFCDAALAAHPLDAWSLYQRGRLSEQNGDPAEAQAAYRAALDLELDLVPALERLAALVAADGDHASAERYYARAVGIAEADARLHSRRGWNAMELGDLTLAEACFRDARRLDASITSARSGLAWWHYATGDPQEATTLFGEIVDDRRSEGEDDPVLLHAEAQIERISEHDRKEVFLDRFDRADGRIGNGWSFSQGYGPLTSLIDGRVVIDGTHDRDGRTRVFRSLPPDRFLAFSVELTVGPNARGTRAGVFLSSERTRSGGDSEVTSEIVLSRDREGNLQIRVLKDRNATDAFHVTVPGPDWDVRDTVRVTIERTGEDFDSRFTLYVQGEPVAANLECGGLMSSVNPIHFGVFVEGDQSRVADLVVTNARIVRYK